jgi:SAM-dependent methyltransferase
MAGFQEKFFSQDFTGKVVIDFACGFGTWGHTIRSMAIQGGDKAYIVGCDAFKPFLAKNKAYNPYDDLVLCEAHHLPFQEKCADIVLCFEMIEHMDKAAGYNFLANLDSLARERLVLSTPNGYMEQHDTGDLEFEEHKSFWLSKDFEQAGFTVRKCGMGLNWEFKFRSLGLSNAIDRVELLRSKGKWNGVMLVAEKNHSGAQKQVFDYGERARALAK